MKLQAVHFVATAVLVAMLHPVSAMHKDSGRGTEKSSAAASAKSDAPKEPANFKAKSKDSGKDVLPDVCRKNPRTPGCAKLCKDDPSPAWCRAS